MGIKRFTYSPAQKVKILSILLILTTIAYGLFEFWAQPETNRETNDRLTRQSIEEVANNFNAFENQFKAESQQFTQKVVNALSTSGLTELFAGFEEDNPFWGISVFRDTTLVAWTEFGAEEFSSVFAQNSTFPHVRLNRDNNVTYLEFFNRIPITEQDTVVRYHLVTRSKIQQSNLLSIGNSSEVDPYDLFGPKTATPFVSIFLNPLLQISATVSPLYSLILIPLDWHTPYPTTTRHLLPIKIKGIFYTGLVSGPLSFC